MFRSDIRCYRGTTSKSILLGVVCALACYGYMKFNVIIPSNHNQIPTREVSVPFHLRHQIETKRDSNSHVGSRDKSAGMPVGQSANSVNTQRGHEPETSHTSESAERGHETESAETSQKPTKKQETNLHTTDEPNIPANKTQPGDPLIAKHVRGKTEAKRLKNRCFDDDNIFGSEDNSTIAARDFHRLLSLRSYNCTQKHRLGRKGDGGYFICIDHQFVPPKNDCLVYSFGINRDWSFDEAIRDKYLCEVHSFDPSINLDDHEHAPGMYFHNLGISGEDTISVDGWQLLKLATIIKNLGHEGKIIDVLKIDVEGSEWPVLCDLLTYTIKTSPLFNVRQLILEIHSPVFNPDVMSLEDYRQITYSIQALDYQLGFRNYRELHQNNCCGQYAKIYSKICCYEAFFINSRFLLHS